MGIPSHSLGRFALRLLSRQYASLSIRVLVAIAVDDDKLHAREGCGD